MVKMHRMIESKGLMFYRFDGGRIGWFMADMHGVFYILAAELLIKACILLIVFGITRLTPIELSMMIHTYLGTTRVSDEWIIVIGILWSPLLAFAYVFLLRRNPTVKLAQRALPYTRYNWI